MAKITLTCLQCSKPFIVLYKQRNRKFCSRSCSSIYSNKRRDQSFFIGDKNPSKRLDIKQKISNALKGRTNYWNIGKKNHNYGGLNDETKKRLSVVHIGINANEKHWNWKGGIIPIKNRIINKLYNNITAKNWAKEILKRDNYTCQFCNKTEVKLCSHHIKPFNKHQKLRYVLTNGITLCISCHISNHRQLNNQLAFEQKCNNILKERGIIDGN